MKAIVQDAYGDTADVLHPAEMDRPTIGDGEVLLRVRAAGVDRGVWHLMAGRPYLARLVIGLRAPKTRVRGREVAGTVEAVGPGVTTLRVGDEVFGIAEGAFAEYAPARADKLALRPEGVSAEEAAAMPISGVTALQAVRDAGKVQSGQHVLVIGASGGVGTFAVQIAKACGAEVTGVCSTAKVDLVRKLGADHVVDYTHADITDADITDADITDGGRRYDVVIDTGGHRALRLLRRALTARGTLVVVGSETEGRLLGGIDRAMLRTPLFSLVVPQTLRALVASEKAADLVVLAGLVESGQVTPAVDRTFPLAEAAAAVRYMTDGRARGKVVVTVR